MLRLCHGDILLFMSYFNLNSPDIKKDLTYIKFLIFLLSNLPLKTRYVTNFLRDQSQKKENIKKK